jgi:type IV secretory pathway VirB2 component (pilin)
VEVIAVLLVIALLLLILFGGLGFAVHILWLGLIVGLIFAVAHVVSRGLTGRT